MVIVERVVVVIIRGGSSLENIKGWMVVTQSAWECCGNLCERPEGVPVATRQRD